MAATLLYRYFYRFLLLSAVASVLWLQSAFAAEQHSDFTKLLQRYVVEDESGVNAVDYAAWRAETADRAALDEYIDRLVQQDPASLENRDAQFAAWANLYNALTLKVVLDHYPVDSIREIRSGLVSGGPWKRKRVDIDGRRFGLDDIEHGVLRVQWSDPRVHYAVNCASIGCPNLRRLAWEADTLDADLDAAAHAYVNHPRGAAITEEGKLRLSRIYKWFRDDFEGSEAGVRAHLAKYADAPLAAVLKQSPAIDEYRYDWSLNDLKGRTQ